MRMTNTTLMACMFAVYMLSTACAGEEGNIDTVSAEDLLLQMKSGAAPLIVDVRTGYEFRRGHIPSAIHMPFYSTTFQHSDLPVAKQDPVVVYCAHGPRASIAKRILSLAGYRNVRTLKGHMANWRASGYPIEK